MDTSEQNIPRFSLAAIDVICYDFDGVMTDNRALVDETGRESVFVNRGDGLAIAAFKKLGVPQIILSTEHNPVVAMRASKLGIPVIQGLADKVAALTKFLNDEGYAAERTIFVGNDVNDLAAMRMVGHPLAPSDAHPSVKSISSIIVTKAKGGAGVIRELYDYFEGIGGTQ